MGLRQLEASILAELRDVAGRRSIRQKDICEWSTGEVTPREDEQLVHLPLLRVNVCVLKIALGKGKGVGDEQHD